MQIGRRHNRWRWSKWLPLSIYQSLIGLFVRWNFLPKSRRTTAPEHKLFWPTFLKKDGPRISPTDTNDDASLFRCLTGPVYPIATGVRSEDLKPRCKPSLISFYPDLLASYALFDTQFPSSSCFAPALLLCLVSLHQGFSKRGPRRPSERFLAARNS